MTCTFVPNAPLPNLVASRPPGSTNSSANEAPYSSCAVVAEVPMLVIERRPDVYWGRPTLTDPTSIVGAGGVASQAGISHAVEFAPTACTGPYCSNTQREVTGQKSDQNC